MVVLSKIYTKTGDAGETALGNGARVAKHSIRVSAYGTVDETNATVGLARQHADGSIWGRISARPTCTRTRACPTRPCA
jgi:cob(I)alamin adenosyltransferase